MAEFCLDCWNKLNGTSYTKRQVRTDMDLCEGCGEWKPVIVAFRRHGILGWLQWAYRWLEDWAWSQRR